MKYSAISIGLSLLLLSGCNSDKYKIQEAIKQQAEQPVIGEKSVWQGNLDKCYSSADVAECILNEISNTGTPEALKAAHYLGLGEQGELGYISSYRQEEPIGIATVEYPTRANTNSGTLLFSSEDQVINIDDILIDLNRFPNRYPIWQKFKQQHSDAFPWAPGTLSKKEQTNNSLKFIYAYPVQTCHACERLATLYISYNFTSAGKFINSHLDSVDMYSNSNNFMLP